MVAQEPLESPENRPCSLSAELLVDDSLSECLEERETAWL